MTQLADRLSALAESGQPISFTALDLPLIVVTGQTSGVAAGPYAPLLAEAVADAYDRDDTHWEDASAQFPDGLASQSSVLHLTASLEALLGSPTAAKALGKAINNALLQGLTAKVHASPLLAAARLEGAVRLAVAKAVTPFKVWQTLEDLPTDGPEDFLERLPRILGLTLDCWAHEESVTDTVRPLLERLSHDEAADVDALFELGCDHLRTALSSKDLGTINGQLVRARKLFQTAACAEEARHDAQTYAAVCDAILAFGRGDAETVATAANRIEEAMKQRAAWLLAAHQPQWMQPRRSAEIAWNRLILQLRAAAVHLQEDVWMDGWEALDTVLAAYSASRTVRPVGGSDTYEGLGVLVQPAIEDSFLRQQSFLSQLRRAAQNTDQHAVRGFDTATAAALLSVIETSSASTREISTPGNSPTVDDGAEDDEEPRRETTARLQRLAPTMLLLLGHPKAVHIARALDDVQLLDVEGLAYDSDIARLKATDPLIVPLLDRLMTDLAAHPAFTGEIRRTFSALVEQTLLFIKSRSDLTRTSLLGPGKKDDPPYDYRRKPEANQRKAVEADLQRDFHHWLQSGPLHNVVLVEPVDMGMGRADVMTYFGGLRYLTEIKKDDSDNSREYLESKYRTQAAEYSNTGAPFGQLLVLDLTPKTHTAGNLRVDELVWTTTHRPQGAKADRFVTIGIVPGNRVTPATYSR